MNPPRILVTNDDGVESEGLKELARRMRRLGKVVVVAPVTERSGCSHSISLARCKEPEHIRTEENCDYYRLDGTPSDCVAIGVGMLRVESIDLVVSGINAGANVGIDAHYSGTVAAALEASLFGIPSLAISVNSRNPQHYETAAKYASDYAELLLKQDERLPFVLNINVPDVPLSQVRGVLYTVLSLRYAEEAYPEGVYERFLSEQRRDYPSDTEALLAGMVSVTPIGLDITAVSMLKIIEEKAEELWARRD